MRDSDWDAMKIPPPYMMKIVPEDGRSTPGPWRIIPVDGDALPAIMAGDVLVCDFGVDTQYYPTAGTPPSDANLWLMASAPELLEACRAACLELTSVEEHGHTHSTAVIKQLEDAIAKASGTVLVCLKRRS